jgi:hypothetical protein
VIFASAFATFIDLLAFEATELFACGKESEGSCLRP